MFSQIDDVQMIRTDDAKLNVYGGEPGELYDLRNDLGEQHNRAEEHPERVKEMAALLKKLRADGRSRPSL